MLGRFSRHNKLCRHRTGGKVLKVKFFSQDAGMMLDVTHIDIMNNKFTVKYGDQKITLDNIDQLLLDTGDKLIKFSEFKNT